MELLFFFAALTLLGAAATGWVYYDHYKKTKIV